MLPSRPLVAIDAHTLGRRATGNETYVRGLVGALSARSEIDAVVLVDPGAPIDPALAPHVAGLRRRHPIARLLGELATPGRTWGAELLHVQYVRPPRCDVPCVTTIHDLSYEHDPSLFTRRSVLRMRATIPWSARHSAAVLTGSRFSRADLIERYRLAPDRVFVTPYAVDSRFRPQDVAVVEATRQRLGLPSDYLLYVGNLQPRKNLPRLLEAFVELESSGTSIPLVIVGQRAWLYDAIFETIRSHALEDRVHLTGYVSDDDLPAVYSGAYAFAYPSLFEGFGLPVLEALACGVPTMTSNVTSLPEVADDAAVLVDPTDIAAMVDALARLLNDDVLRARLKAAGPKHAARFSWDRCAAATTDVYRSVIRESASS